MCLTTTIDVLRHGEAQGGDYYRGRTDDPLTAQGWQQMRTWLNQPQHWTRLVSSPLRRCLDFANHMQQVNNLPLQIDARFQELHFGDWEGKTAAEIEQTQPAALQLFYQQPFQHSPPQGENMTEFSRRVAAAWQDLFITARGEIILLVTHAGVIRSLFSQVLKMPTENCFAIEVGHAALSRFCCYHSEEGDFVQLKFHKNLDI